MSKWLIKRNGKEHRKLDNKTIAIRYFKSLKIAWASEKWQLYKVDEVIEEVKI